MKKWLTCLLIALGALAAPGFSHATEADTFIQKRYPKATLKNLHTDTEKKEWIYQVTPTSGEPFIAAYSRAKARSGYYPLLLTATPEGEIISVELPGYPHTHGRKATTASFLKQYRDKTADEISYGHTIHGVTGATATAESTAKKVRELLKLMEAKK